MPKLDKSLIKKLSLALVLSASFVSYSHGSDEKVYQKVIGRGVEERTSGEVLQLACVGPKDPKNYDEHDCTKLQFIHIIPKNGVRSIGPIFEIKPDKKVSKQIRKNLEAQGVIKKRRLFPMLYWLLEKEDKGHSRTIKGLTMFGIPLSTLIILGNAEVIQKFWLPVGASAGASLTAFSVIGIFLTPIIIPGIIDLTLMKGVGTFSHRAKTLEALQSKSRPSWQFNARKVGSKKFQKMLKALQVPTSTTGINLSVPDEVIAMNIDREIITAEKIETAVEKVETKDLGVVETLSIESMLDSDEENGE